MLFTELRFLVFFLLAFGLHWALRSNAWRKRWLLVCSYVFYGAWDWRFCSLILASTVIDYVAGYSIARATRKSVKQAYLTLSLVFNLGLLGVFKYLNFFIESGTGFLELFGLEPGDRTLSIILPVGISFYTFQTISYTIDVYRGFLKPIRSFWDFGLFVAFFPQLVAGPIVRAVEFLPQLDTKRRFADVNVRAMVTLFLFGFIKKACIADNLAPYVDPYFAAPELYTAPAAWKAVVYHMVQFYCDFSGYTDMAIASAGLLGYRLPENFRFPYFSRNIDLFWRRWHISMSSWFRDYLFLPLCRVRKGRRRIWQNTLISFSVIGLWHGAAWNFVLFGFMHGVYMVVHAAWKATVPQDSVHGRLSRIFGNVLVFFAFVPTLVMFRSTDFEKAWLTIETVATMRSPGTETLGTWFWLLVPGMTLIHWIGYKGWVVPLWRKVPDWLAWFLLGGLAALSLQWAAREYQAFIYFQF